MESDLMVSNSSLAMKSCDLGQVRLLVISFYHL